MKILVVKKGALGDMIAGTAALLQLRQKYPGAAIVLLGDTLAAEICPAGTIVDEVIDIQAFMPGLLGFLKLLRLVRRQKFDIAVNLRWKSDMSALIALLSGAPIKLGGGKGFYTRFYTRFDKRLFEDENRHEYRINTDILRPLDIRSERLKTYLHVTAADRSWARKFMQKHGLKSRNFMLLTPIASNPLKAWSEPGFVDVARRFTEKFKTKIVVSYAPGDAAAAERVARAAGRNALLSGQTTIGQLAALVKSARLVLCNNSGIIHVAHSVETPVVCLNTSLGWAPFGGEDTAITRLPSHLPVEQNRHLPNEEVAKLLAGISVAEVWELLQRRWRELGRRN
jgi:heptosyltransferase-2